MSILAFYAGVGGLLPNAKSVNPKDVHSGFVFHFCNCLLFHLPALRFLQLYKGGYLDGSSTFNGDPPH